MNYQVSLVNAEGPSKDKVEFSQEALSAFEMLDLTGMAQKVSDFPGRNVPTTLQERETI